MKWKGTLCVLAAVLFCTSLVASAAPPQQSTAAVKQPMERPMIATAPLESASPKQVTVRAEAAPAAPTLSSVQVPGGLRGSPPNDDCESATPVTLVDGAPQVLTGDNSGATTDCPALGGPPECWYVITVPEPMDVTIAYCGTAPPFGNAYIVLDTECPCSGAWIFATNWETTSCGDGNWTLHWDQLAAGTYYWPLLTEAGSEGPYTVTFTGTGQPPCSTECPPGATVEGEPVCYDDYEDNYNGGCNSTPFVFQPITCQEMICGTSGTFYYAGYSYRDTDWYEVELTAPTNVTWTVCAEFEVLIFVINGGSGNCTDYTVLGDAIGSPFEQTTLNFDVGPGLYWFWVGPTAYGSGVPCGSEYVATLFCVPPPNDDCEDAQVINAPYPVTVPGTTVGATLDCPDLINWNGVWYDVQLPYASNDLTVTICPLEEDITTSGIIVMDDCACDDYINTFDYTWITCPGGYQGIEIRFPELAGPGRIYFPLYVYPQTNYHVTFDVAWHPPCDLECPPGSIPEGEPVCYDGYVDTYNGGCNSTPYVWQPINCGDVICGTSGVYNAQTYRDTDWFEILTDRPMELTWTAIAEFPVLIFIIDSGSGNCMDYTILDYTTGPACEEVSLSTMDPVPPGRYWFWIGPSDWGNYPCGVEYIATLTCEPVCEVECPPDGTIEGEPVCYDNYIDTYNGGCNSTPYIWQPITCQETICGTSGTFYMDGLSYRDTDWFEIELPAPANVTWTVCAEFEVLIFVIDGGSGDCFDYTILGYDVGAPFRQTTLSFDVDPGRYWLWVGPTVYGSGVPCGSEYVGTLIVDPNVCCVGDVDGDGDTDLNDLARLLAAYGSRPGDPNWNPAADLDGDGDVDLTDLAILLSDYGCG